MTAYIDQVLSGLTKAQKCALREVRISDQVRSDWKHRRRSPTLPQLRALALASGADFTKLASELADMEASPEQLSFFRSAVARAQAVAASVAVAVLAVLADPSTMYIM